MKKKIIVSLSVFATISELVLIVLFLHYYKIYKFDNTNNLQTSVNDNLIFTSEDELNQHIKLSGEDFKSDIIKKYYSDNINIPEKFNLKHELKEKHNIDIPVADQKNVGICTIFSLLKSVETNYALKNGEYIDLSERYISYMLSDKFYAEKGNAGIIDNLSSDYATDNLTEATIGNVYQSLAILEIFGSAGENEIPYINYEDSNLEILKNAKPLLNVEKYIEFPRFLTSDNKNEWLKILKIHIMKYGSLMFANYAPFDEFYNNVYNSYNKQYGGDYDTHSYTISAEEYNNAQLHELSIVGWDDNYPKENFTIQPKNDGAFIVLNSWGSEWGKNGYYYISYESDNFFESIVGIISSSKADKFEIISKDNYIFSESKYTPTNINNRFYGFKFDNNGQEIKKILSGIKSSDGFLTVNVYINKYDDSFDPKKMIKLKMVNNDYYTSLTLNEPIKLKGDKFSVVFEVYQKADYYDDIEYTKSVDYRGQEITNTMYVSEKIDGDWTLEKNGFPVFLITSSN